MCVCVCVTEVGLWGGTRLVMCDLRTSTRTLQRMFENIGHDMEQLGLRADAIVEQQSKRMQSGSSRWSGRHRRAELKWTQSGSSSWSGRKRRAAAEADASWELSSSWNGSMQSCREQQLKRTQLGSSSSAQRAIRHRITHVGKQGGSSWSWASEASEATCTY